MDQLGLEPTAENHHQLIHHYIPALTFGPAICKVADIQEQNLMTDSSVGKTLRLEMFLRICECRLSMALVV